MKNLIFLLTVVLFISHNSYAQLTYSTNPSPGYGTWCPSSNLNCALYAGPNNLLYQKDVIELRVLSIDQINRKVYLQVKKCNGTFANNGHVNFRQDICDDYDHPSINFNQQQIPFYTGESYINVTATLPSWFTSGYLDVSCAMQSYTSPSYTQYYTPPVRIYANCTMPGYPSWYSYNSISDSQIDLSWESVSNATVYEIYTCSGSFVGSTYNTSFPITGLLANSANYFKIRTYNDCGYIDINCLDAIYTRPAPPNAPTNPAGQCNSATLTQNGPSIPANVGYYWQGTNCDAYSTADNSNTYVATQNGQYYYLRAYNSSTGLWSATCGQAYVNFGVSPAQVGGLTSTGQTTSSINLQWNTAANTNTYQIWNCVTGQQVTNGTVNHPANTFNVQNLNSNSSYQFKVRAVNSCGYTESPCITRSTLCAAPSISGSGQPQNATVTLPSTSTTFSVTASGSPTLTYQWQRSTNGGGTWLNVSGATSSSLLVSGIIASMNGYQYRCIVSGACSPAVTSNAGILTVGCTGTVVNSQPASLAVNLPGTTNASFSVSATGVGLTYQWQLRTTAGGSWFDIANGAHGNGGTYANVTTATLGVSNIIPAMNGYAYRCRITNTCSSVVNTNGSAQLTATSITVTSPNGGETFSAGGNMPITWTSTNLSGALLAIEIIRCSDNSVITPEIAYNTANDGTQPWTIPSNFAAGQYKIKIYRVNPNPPAIFDLSDACFTIIPQTPGAPQVPGSPVVNCNSAMLQHTGTIPSGVTWFWQGNNPANCSGSTGAVNLGQAPNQYGPITANNTYCIRARDNATQLWSACGCIAVNNITTSPTATARANGNLTAATVTAPSAISLTATSSISGSTFSWSGPNNFSSTQQNPPAINPSTTANAGQYCVTATANGCSSTPACVTVTVNPPLPTFTVNTFTAYPWQRKGDPLLVSINVSTVGGNYDLLVNGSPVFSNLTQNTLHASLAINTYLYNPGDVLNYSVRLSSTPTSQQALGPQTDIIEEKWVQPRNIAFNSTSVLLSPSGDVIAIPLSYDPQHTSISITFDRGDCTSHAFGLQAYQTIPSETLQSPPFFAPRYFLLDNMDLGGIRAGIFTYTITYTGGSTPSESATFDLTKYGRIGGAGNTSNTAIVFIGGLLNEQEADMDALTGIQSSTVNDNLSFSVALGLKEEFDVWYIAQPNLNYVVRNAYDIGNALDSIKSFFPNKEYHLVVHSKGGLDSRALVQGMAEPLHSNITVPFWAFDIESSLKSISFIGTPHRGASLANKYGFLANILATCVTLPAIKDLKKTAQIISLLNYGSLSVPSSIRLSNFTGYTTDSDDGTSLPTDGVVELQSSYKPIICSNSPPNCYNGLPYPLQSMLQDEHVELHKMRVINANSNCGNNYDRLRAFILNQNVTGCQLSNALETSWGLIASELSHGTVNVLRNGVFKPIGISDETGRFSLLNFEVIAEGDTIWVKSPDTEYLYFEITEEELSGRKFTVPMLSSNQPTNQIIYPKVSITNYAPVFTQPNVQLNLTAGNLLNYQVYDPLDAIAPVQYAGNISSFNYAVTDTGINYIRLDLFGPADTITIIKEVYYFPPSEVQARTFTIPLALNSADLLNTKLYVDGYYVKELTSMTDNLVLHRNIHTVRFSRFGFSDSTYVFEDPISINVNLQPFSYVSETDSVVEEHLPNGLPRYYKAMTTDNAGNVAVTVSKKRIASPFGLTHAVEPRSDLFQLRRLAGSPAAILRTAMVLDQQEFLTPDSVYLLLNGIAGVFEKFPFPYPNVTYDSLVQKVLLDSLYFPQSSSVLGLSLNRKLAPIAIGSALSANEDESIAISIYDLFADPDSIPNDLTFNVTGNGSGITVQVVGDSIFITLDDNYNGSTSIDLEATHDWLTVSHTFDIQIEPVNDAPQIAEVESISFCVGSDYTLDLTNYLTDIDNPIGDLIIQVEPILVDNPLASVSDLIATTNQQSVTFSNSTIEGNFTVVVVANDGQDNSTVQTFLVHVSPQFQVAIEPEVPVICDGQPMEIWGVGGQTYVWSFAGLEIGSDDTLALPTSIPLPGLTQYVISVVATNGACESTAQITVPALQSPIVTIQADLTEVCEGDSVILVADGADQYLWQSSEDFSIASSSSIWASPLGNAIYQVSGESAVGGCEGTDEVFITVNSSPLAPTIADNGLGLQSSYPTGNQWYLNGQLMPGETGQTLNNPGPGTYTVEYTDENGCTSISDPYVIIVTGITDESGITKIEVYPNPNNGQFELVLSEFNNQSTYQIFDNLGQLTQTGNITSERTAIDMSKSSVGVYMLRLMDGQELLETKRLVLLRN
ncbi:MAG: T9SS type A sorting domain-containing protein [Flavobacteriales bacterium]|nr:T9SS type A sorting domain-containing protein [Flavobacteriales bacterium]